MNRKNLLMLALSVLVILLAGIIFYMSYNKQPALSSIPAVQEKNATSEQSTPSALETENKSVVYANVQYGKNDGTSISDPLKNVDFYSVKLDGSVPIKLFSLPANQTNRDITNSDLTFCPATQKLYLLENTAYGEEIDMKGNVRELTFMEDSDPALKNLDRTDAGLAFSADGSKMIWGAAYFQSSGGYDKIYISDVDGNNKKALLDTREDSTNKIMWIKKWSVKNPDIVYLTDYNWDRNGGGGGLYTLNINDGKIQRIPQIPENSGVSDISPDGNKIVYQPSYPNVSNSFVLNLIDNSVVTVENSGSSGKKLFSPLGDKLANVDYDCSGEGDQASCTSNLYVFTNKHNTEIAPGVDLIGWISEGRILGSNANIIVSVNSDGSGAKNIATANDKLIYIGMLK